MDVAAIQSWTPLPPLPLRGLESGLAESLDHYALRMAHLCGIPRSRLASLLRTHGGLEPNEFAGQYLSSWTGPRSAYAVLMNPLIELTGRTELFKGTFHCVAGVLGRGGLATRTGRNSRRRWCPRCYLEWDPATSHEPLVWAFSVLVACPLHGVLLEGACQSCGIEQRFDRQYDVRRQCAGCKRSLGHPGEPAQLDETQTWVDGVLRRFAEFVASLDQPVDRAPYDLFIDGLSERLQSGESIPPAIRTYIGQRLRSRDVFGGLPTIMQYLNLCAFQGCDIEDILTNPKDAAARQLFDRGEGYTRIQFQKRVITRNIREMGFCIDAMLGASSNRLPPIGFLYREFGLWGSVVRDHFADMHRIYLDRYESQTGEFQRYYESRAFESALHLCKVDPSFIQEDDTRRLSQAVAKATALSESLSLSCAASVIALCRIRKTFDPAAAVVHRHDEWRSYVTGKGTP